MTAIIEALNRVFLWFYCLDLSDAILVVVFFSLLFWVLNQALHRRIWWKFAVGLALALWIAVLLHSTLGQRSEGSGYTCVLVPFHSYREVLRGGNREILRSNLMNVLLFVPAGLLGAAVLPRKWPGWLRVTVVFLVFAVFSGGIEYCQYHYRLGRTEIDDVIHNAFGALLGSIAVILPKK